MKVRTKNGFIVELESCSVNHMSPLFMMVFGGIVAGLLIGFVWEWLREHKHRIEATRQGREARKLKREVEALKSEKRQARGEDDVLALLEDAR